MAPGDDADAWYEDEEPWGRSFVVELQRLQRRAAARPLITLALALAMTALVVVRVVRKPQTYIAHVVIAVTEGNLVSGREPVPVREMQEYVHSALLPDAKLKALIEELDLFPLRKKLGMPFALQELREMFDVTVYRNYFVSDTFDPYLRRTARIEIAVGHADPRFAAEVASRIAGIIVGSADEIQDTYARQLSTSAIAVRDRAHADVDAIDHRLTEQTHALREAEAAGKTELAVALRTQIGGLALELHEQQRKLAIIDASLLVDRTEAAAMAAGLDLRLEVVSERRPVPDVGRGTKLALIAIALFVLFVPVAAVLVGAFDARIHDTGDITRLGYVSLGELPPYPGDRIGSLRGRGVRRRRAAQY